MCKISRNYCHYLSALRVGELCNLLPVGDDIDENRLRQWKIDADGGDERAQLSVGKHYLNRAQFDEDSQTNAKLAVLFLVKSSVQGNEAATELLKDCLDKELGKYVYSYTTFTTYLINIRIAQFSALKTLLVCWHFSTVISTYVLCSNFLFIFTATSTTTRSSSALMFSEISAERDVFLLIWLC